MPYQRRLKRTFGKKRVNNYKTGGRQLYSDVMYLKSLVNAELHQKTHVASAHAIESSGVITHISDCGQGNGIGQRAGQTTLPKYVNAKYCVSNQNAGIQDTCRVIIFMWKDASLPTVSDVLETTSCWSHYKIESAGGPRDRTLNILSDRTYSIINGSDKQCVNQKLDLKLNRPGVKIPVHVKYNGNSPDEPQNGIYFLTLGTKTSASGNNSILDGSFKFSFYDN